MVTSFQGMSCLLARVHSCPQSVTYVRVLLLPMCPVCTAQAIMIASHTEAEPGFQNHGRVPTSVMAFETWIRGLSGTATPEAVAFAICKPGVDRCLGTVMILSLIHI